MWENLFLFYGSDHVNIFPSPLLQQQHLVSPTNLAEGKNPIISIWWSNIWDKEQEKMINSLFQKGFGNLKGIVPRRRCLKCLQKLNQYFFCLYSRTFFNLLNSLWLFNVTVHFVCWWFYELLTESTNPSSNSLQQQFGPENLQKAAYDALKFSESHLWHWRYFQKADCAMYYVHPMRD